MVKLNMDGRCLCFIELNNPGGTHWQNLFFDRQGNIYFSSGFKEDEIFESYLIAFDSNLRLFKKVLLPEVSFAGLIDCESERLYMFLFEREILAFALSDLEVIIRKNNPHFESVHVLDLNGNIHTTRGSSTIEIRNRNLDLISRHKTKGAIQKVFLNKQGIATYVTWNKEWEGGNVRVYEVR